MPISINSSQDNSKLRRGQSKSPVFEKCPQKRALFAKFRTMTREEAELRLRKITRVRLSNGKK